MTRSRCSDRRSITSEGLADGAVDRIFCNELWNDLATKLMSRQGGDIEEEFLRPNLSDVLHAKIEDWADLFVLSKPRMWIN